MTDPVKKGYSRRSKAIELLNGEYEKMVLRIEELEKENKLLKKNQKMIKCPLPSMQDFNNPD